MELIIGCVVVVAVIAWFMWRDVKAETADIEPKPIIQPTINPVETVVESKPTTPKKPAPKAKPVQKAPVPKAPAKKPPVPKKPAKATAKPTGQKPKKPATK